MSIHLVSRSEEETRGVGRRFGRVLRGGERIGLAGELGAGKTVFVKGVAEGLGIDPDDVRSPSFLRVLEYEGGRLPLVHLDLFRSASEEVDENEMRELLYGNGVCVIEWFDRLGSFLEDFLEIQFTIVGTSERALVATPHGLRYNVILDASGDPGE